MQRACHLSSPLGEVRSRPIFNNLGFNRGFWHSFKFVLTYLSSAQNRINLRRSDIATAGSDSLLTRDFSLTQNEIAHRVQLFNNLRLSHFGKE